MKTRQRHRPAKPRALGLNGSAATSVLVVDDRPTDRDLIATVLSQAGHAVPVAATGEVAMGLAVSNRPDFRDTTLEMADRHRMQRELDALIWVGRIRDALDDDHMLLYSQPILPLTGGQPSEELLLRMSRRKDEIVLPGDPELLSVIERQLHDTGADPSNIVRDHRDSANARYRRGRSVCPGPV